MPFLVCVKLRLVLWSPSWSQSVSATRSVAPVTRSLSYCILVTGRKHSVVAVSVKKRPAVVVVTVGNSC